ncbi:hypothetical protein Tco_0478131 [Tanacetum coccineum]
MDLEATDASTQQNTEQIDEEFTTTAYLNVQENLKLPIEDQVILEDPTSSTGTLSSLQNLDKELNFTNQFLEEKPHEDEPEKTNTESEVQSMVTVPIHQDTFSVPPMATPVIDLTVSHPVSTTVHAPLPTSTVITTAITTTTSLSPPPPQPQQSSSDPILLQRIRELEQHIVDLIQSNLALEERLDKHGTRQYNVENLNIPQKASKAVDEIVTDAEVLQQRMFEDKSYLAHEDHKNLFEALEMSLERDYSNQLLSDLEEARMKKRKKRTSGASGSSHLPLPPPPPSTGTSGSAQQQGSKAPSSSKTTASTPQSMVGTTSDTRYESTGVSVAHESSPTDSLMNEDSIPKEQTIPSSNISDVENNLASALVSTYEPPAENSLLAKIGDMTTFMNWYCSKVNKTVLTQADFEGRAYEVVKAFYPDVIHLQFQMEECYKMLTNQIIWTNLEGDQVRINVSQPVPPMVYLTGGSIDISSILRDMILRHVKEKSEITCEFSVSSVLKPIQDTVPLVIVLDYLSSSDKRMLSTAVKLWTQNLVIRQRVMDFQLGIESYQKQLNLTKPGWDAKGYEFKHDYTIIESPRVVVFPINHNERKIMRFNKIYKFSDGTLTRILEALDYIVKEFKIKRLNPGMNTRFWTQKDVTRSKEFMTSIERRLKTRRIYRIWNALLVDVFVILTTDFFRERNDIVIPIKRRFGLRTASAAAKPYQGDSSEFYLITDSIYTD